MARPAAAAAGGLVIADELRVQPAVADRLRACAERVVILPAAKLAAEAGNTRAANTVLIGALSRRVGLPIDFWKAALRCCLRPSLVEANLRAFELGQRHGATS